MPALNFRRKKANKVPAPPTAQEVAAALSSATPSLGPWLEANGLESYEEVLAAQGFTEMATLLGMGPGELGQLAKSVGMLPGHAAAFKQAVSSTASSLANTPVPVPVTRFQEEQPMYADNSFDDHDEQESRAMLEDGLRTMEENNQLRRELGMTALRMPRLEEMTAESATRAMEERTRLQAMWSAMQVSAQEQGEEGFAGAGALLAGQNVAAAQGGAPQLTVFAGDSAPLPMVPLADPNAPVPAPIRLRGVPLRLHCKLRGAQPVDNDGVAAGEEPFYRTYIRDTHVYCMCVVNGMLAASTSDRCVAVYETQNMTRVVTLNWTTDVVVSLSEVQGMLACAVRDGSVVLWNTSTWDVAARLPPSTHVAWGIVGFDDKLCVSEDTQLVMHTKRRRGFKRAEAWEAHDDMILCMALVGNGTGNFIVTGSNDHSARVWNPSAKKKNRLAAELHGHTAAITCIAPVGGAIGGAVASLATGSEDTNICVWFTNTWTLKATLVGHASFITSMVTVNDLFFSAAGDHRMKVWCGNSLIILDNKDTGSEVVTSLQEIGGRLATGMDNGVVKLWEL